MGAVGSQGEDPGAGKLGHLPTMTQLLSGAETPQPCSPVPPAMHSPAPACAPRRLSLAPLLLCLTHTLRHTLISFLGLSPDLSSPCPSASVLLTSSPFAPPVLAWGPPAPPSPHHQP